MIKKLLSSLLLFLFPLIASAQFTVPQGGTGTTTFPANWPVIGSSALRVTAVQSLPAANGGTGQTSFSVGDILYASGASTLSKLNIGTSGQVLTVNGGVPIWLDPTGGGGGSDSNWVFSPTLGLIRPATTTNAVVVGGAATSTTGNILEVIGNALFRNNVVVNSNTTLAQATSTNFAITSILSSILKTNGSGSIIPAIAGTDYENPLTFSSPLSRSVNTVSLNTVTVPFGGTGSTTLTGILKGNGTGAVQTAVAGTDYQAPGNYITALTGDVTASGPGSVPATLATVNANVGSFTNANITVNGKGLITAASNGTDNSFSTTSADYWLTVNRGNAYSTTSADYWLTQNRGNAFSTTSASYFLSVNQGNAFSTTSTDYYNSQSRDWSIQGNGYLAPTTTRGVFINASSTIGNGTQAGGITISGGATTTATTTLALGAGGVGVGGLPKADSKLTVNMSSSASINVRDTLAANNYYGVYFDLGAQTLGSIRANTSGEFRIGGDLATTYTTLYTSGNESARITALGNFGIATTSPFERLSVAGSVYISGNLVATGTASTTNLAITSLTGSTQCLQVNSLGQVSGTGSACGSGGGGGGTDKWATSTDSVSIYPNAALKVGIGTTTPNWLLQIASTTPYLAITDTDAGTDAKHWFLQNNGGMLNVGTSSDSLTSTSSILQLRGDAYGLTVFDGKSGFGSSSPFAKVSIHADQNDLGGYNSTLFAIASSTPTATTTILVVNASGKTGIGTTTPAWPLQIASTSTPQMTLSDGSLTSPHWSWRNAGGTMYIATSSPTTYATSSNPAIQFSGASETRLGVATSSPWRTLSVTGTVGMDGLTAAAGTVQGVCLVTATKELTANSSANCTTSSRRFKHDIEKLTISGTDQVMALTPSSFVYNDSSKLRIGFVAEEIFEVNPLLVDLDAEGKPHSLDTTGILSIVTKALQENIKGDKSRDKKIQDLEEKIEKLENIIKSYEKTK